MKESKFQFNTPYLEELEFSINNDFTNKSVDVEMMLQISHSVYTLLLQQNLYGKI